MVIAYHNKNKKNSRCVISATKINFDDNNNNNALKNINKHTYIIHILLLASYPLLKPKSNDVICAYKESVINIMIMVRTIIIIKLRGESNTFSLTFILY